MEICSTQYAHFGEIHFFFGFNIAIFNAECGDEMRQETKRNSQKVSNNGIKSSASRMH